MLRVFWISQESHPVAREYEVWWCTSPCTFNPTCATCCWAVRCLVLSSCDAFSMSIFNCSKVSCESFLECKGCCVREGGEIIQTWVSVRLAMAIYFLCLCDINFISSINQNSIDFFFYPCHISITYRLAIAVSSSFFSSHRTPSISFNLAYGCGLKSEKKTGLLGHWGE